MTLSPGLEYLLRLFGALAYMFGGAIAFASFVPGLPAAVYIAVFFALMFSAPLVFNRDRWARIRNVSMDEHVGELEQKGKIERETIRSTRAIYFEYLPTSSVVYLIECGDQRLLCLYGQYLYDWGAITDDEEGSRPRAFPTTEFDVVRRLPRREVFDLALRGQVYVPDVVEPSEKQLAALRLPLEDGAYLEGVTYESMLRQLMEVR